VKASNLSRRPARVGVVLASGVALLAWSGVSSAAKAPPPKGKELSAISQYRESIPTPVGPTFPAPGPSQKAPLPPGVERKVASKGGADARVLKRIATESNLGAPQKKLRSVPRARVAEEKSVPGAVLNGAGTLVTDGKNGHLIGLAVVMALLAVAAGAGALRRPKLARRGVGEQE
jgi:hypothetical protein